MRETRYDISPGRKFHVRHVCVLYFFILFLNKSAAQQIPHWGVPYIDVYTPESYLNAGKVWDISSASNGILYFATDKGLLEYDGFKWKKYKGSKGSTRALYVLNDTTIYTGSDLDFGVWKRRAYTEFEYTSLYPFKENVNHITEEFWGVYRLDDFIVFTSFDNVYVLKDSHLTKVAAPGRFSKTFQVNELIYLVDDKVGVFTFDGVALKLLFSNPDNDPLDLVSISPPEMGSLIVTHSKGLYRFENGNLIPWDKDISEHLKKDKVFAYTSIENKYHVYGTILNGIYIVSNEGIIIQHINKPRGLTNNTILDLYYSKSGMLWASLDFGLVGMYLNDNIAYVFDHNGLFGTGQTALLQGSQFYLGTNQGLYTSKWSEINNDVKGISFSIIPNSEGQVWALAEADNQVLCGHDNGLYRVENQKFIPIDNSIGVLDILVKDEKTLFAGTYNGIDVYDLIEDQWRMRGKLELIKGACEKLVLDKEKNLWIKLPNYGIIKASLNDNNSLNSRIIFEQDEFEGEILSLENIDGEIVVTTTECRYVFNDENGTFRKKDQYFDINQIQHRLPNNYAPISLQDSFLFYSVYNGFAIKKGSELRGSNTPLQLVIRKLELYNRESNTSFQPNEDIPYNFNNIAVSVVIPNQRNALYRYKLEGYNNQWTAWSTNHDYYFVHLDEGNYKLDIEGMTTQNELISRVIEFRVSPPWYRSLMAYAVYFIGLFLIYFLIQAWQRHKLNQQKHHLKLQKQKALEDQAKIYSEEAMFKKYEALESEKQHIEKELRSTKVELIKKIKEDDEKGKLLKSLNEKLSLLKSSNANNTKVKELLKIIERSKNDKNDSFQIHIDELNQNYIHNLKAIFPSLSMYDLRLCTYIKTGLSTREIADIMNVLPSSINVSRSRLRKKLNLESNDDLFSFLDSLKDEE